jgi:hypothetical protein
METWKDYLKRIEPPLRILFSSLNEYRTALAASDLPELITGAGNDEDLFSKFTSWSATAKPSKEPLPRERARKSADSVTPLAKSILQFAYIAIDKYSLNTSVSADLLPLVREHAIPAKFFVGRRIRNVPLGLILYAGHGYFGGKSSDPSYEGARHVLEILLHSRLEDRAMVGFQAQGALHVNNPKNCLDIIGWKTVHDYYHDMAVIFHNPHTIER